MTRKQAVSEAIRIMMENAADMEIIEKLKQIEEELPMVRWTHESILDATAQYILDNGRFPPKREFTGRLPGPNTVKHFFNVSSLAEYRTKYFADALYSLRIIGYEDKDYMMNTFRKNYDRIGEGYSVSFQEYNEKREKGSPNIHTLMRNLNCPTYNKLREVCGVSDRDKKNTPTVNLTFHSDPVRTVTEDAVLEIKAMSAKYAS